MMDWEKVLTLYSSKTWYFSHKNTRLPSIVANTGHTNLKIHKLIIQLYSLCVRWGKFILLLANLTSACTVILHGFFCHWTQMSQWTW